jgi:hypothetical protein
MPTIAGTYLIRVFPFEDVGGAFEMDLSTGPVGGDAPPPPPPPPPSLSLHVGDLDDTSITLSSSKWRARAQIKVHDGEHVGLPGAVVRGRFGPNGVILSCTTGTAGACTLTRDLKRTRLSINFVVLSVSKSTYTYAEASNHDPEGDSNGTTIVVTRP